MSIPLLCLILVLLSEKIFQRKIFSPRDWKVASIFGAIASFVLYPSALGLTHIDTYGWGWASQEGVAFATFLAAMALLTIFLLWRKNKFGVVLLLALFAFALHAKTSTNFWDYLIDPIYGVSSLIAVLILLCKAASARARSC